MKQDSPVTLLVCALGGEGGGVLTHWLVDIAHHAGHAAQSTSIPGVAQRTGATTYYIEVFPVPLARLGGRHPVFSLSPVPGALDALVSSELLETARQVGNGMVSPRRTLVITSSARSLTTQERMPPGDGRAEGAALHELVRSFSRAHHVLDMTALAREAGTAVSAVMLGAIAASGLFPFTREECESVVRRSGSGAEASLRGFALGFEAVGGGGRPAAVADRIPGSRSGRAATAGAAQFVLADDLPPPVRDIAALGHARVVEYQDRAYGELYARRLREVLAAEREADPAGERDFAITRETARWLALWMAFDDIVRVADLKSRAARWDRVRRETKAGERDLLRVYDHFKPGAPEFAALLPPALAARVLRWDRRRVQAGKAPWGLPLKIGAHTASGMLALRALASLKWLRIRGSRYADEQQMIGRWLDSIAAGARRQWQLGHELALCGRLIKGYGATNERGKDNLLHLVDRLACQADAAGAARAIEAARAAALSDEAGNTLDAALARHGAPPRPPKEQPIHWVRRPGAGARKPRA